MLLKNVHTHPHSDDKISGPGLYCEALKRQWRSISQSSGAWPLLAHHYLPPHLVGGVEQEKRVKKRKRCTESESDGGETEEARVGVKRKIKKNKKRVDEKGKGKKDVGKSANITSHITAYLVSTRLVSTHGTTELRDQYI